jgi:rSAM/selenodomain-associated transferase 1
MRAIGVMARAPLPGRCKARLLAAHSADWVAGLYAAMLRDTLDGLQSVAADAYLVFVEPVEAMPGEDTDDEVLTKLAFDVLGRHVPVPWELVLQQGADQGARMEQALTAMFDRGATYALLAGSDAPSFPTEPLAALFAEDGLANPGEVLLGPSEGGGYYLIGMSRVEPRLVRDIPWSTPAIMDATRLRCRELGLTIRELPRWYDVEEPSDVMKLLDEVRKHPERAPRTAQFLVMHA